MSAPQSDSILAQRVRERMAAIGTNPHRLSKAIGARDTVRMILSGRSAHPRYDTLLGLARELDCDVSYLLGLVDEPGKGAKNIPAQVTPITRNRVTLDIYQEVSPSAAARILAILEEDQ